MNSEHNEPEARRAQPPAAAGGEAAAVPVSVAQRVIDLKTWPSYFQAILDGRKRFEVRQNDRDYLVGDVLVLREWDPNGGFGTYTGREYRVRVAYLMHGGQFGLSEGAVVMSIDPAPLPGARP